MSTRLFDTLDEVAGLLDRLDRVWALVGGLAVSAYVEPRFTRDIDIVLSVENDADAEAFVRKWRSSGFEITTVIEHEKTGRLATIRSNRLNADHGVVVDILFASSGIEPEIAEQARMLNLSSEIQLPVARPGHLVALKLLAADSDDRPQDEIDLAELIGILDAEETRLAREAVRLIEDRGYDRGRNLQEMLEQKLAPE